MFSKGVLFSVLSRPRSLAPAAVVYSGDNLKIRRPSFVLCLAGDTKLGSLQSCIWGPSYGYSSTTCFCSKRGTFQPKIQLAGLQASSLQAITAENDSSNSDTVRSPAHDMRLSSGWSQREDSRPFFVSALQGLRDRLWRIKERGWLKSSKQAFEEAYAKLMTVDGKVVFEDVLVAKVVERGPRVWQTAEPWIMWPLTVFSVVFLVVLISCGVEVAQDLLPLWIIGPLVMGLIIRMAYWAGDLTKTCLASIEPFLQAAIVGTLQLYKNTKDGKLFEELHSLFEVKKKELNEEMAKRRSDLVLYVKSGEAATDFQILLMSKFSHLSDWSVEKYGDFLEWVRPFWRAFTRLMKKLF